MIQHPAQYPLEHYILSISGLKMPQFFESIYQVERFEEEEIGKLMHNADLSDHSDEEMLLSRVYLRYRQLLNEINHIAASAGRLADSDTNQLQPSNLKYIHPMRHNYFLASLNPDEAYERLQLTYHLEEMLSFRKLLAESFTKHDSNPQVRRSPSRLLVVLTGPVAIQPLSSGDRMEFDAKNTILRLVLNLLQELSNLHQGRIQSLQYEVEVLITSHEINSDEYFFFKEHGITLRYFQTLEYSRLAVNMSSGLAAFLVRDYSKLSEDEVVLFNFIRSFDLIVLPPPVEGGKLGDAAFRNLHQVISEMVRLMHATQYCQKSGPNGLTFTGLDYGDELSLQYYLGISLPIILTLEASRPGPSDASSLPTALYYQVRL
jgi:hypothetical protein